ncbi:MAG: glycosyltransferase family 4 protein [Gammaproteobacteria bacterium]|nr:glycosyltransferase family 4 protein [Gammaproteobacteria bacterium]
MQIAFCLFKYFPHGGISRDLMKMARECLHRGHRVRVYVLHWNAPELEEDCFELVIVPVTALTNHSRYERFAEWVRDHLDERPVDLVVGLNKMPGLDVYYAGDSCYEEKARTQRNLFYRFLPRYRHFASAERAVFDTASHTEILTISNVQTPIFRKHYRTPPERFHPLPPGIDRDRAAPANKNEIRAELRQEFGITENELLLLFVGSGFIKKGLDRVLFALHGLPGPLYERTRLFVLGNDNAEPFRRMAKRLGVDMLVRFLDGRDDVPRFLFSADGLLLPAYDENAGMVILEAMIARLPALVTPNCGYAHYLKDAGAGLVAPDPFRQEEFNQLVVELLTSEERSNWSTNGGAVAEREEIYLLAEKAVDYLEMFARGKREVNPATSKAEIK